MVLVMIGLTALGVGTAAKPEQFALEMLSVLVKGLAMLALVALLIRYILPHLTHHPKNIGCSGRIATRHKQLASNYQTRPYSISSIIFLN